jgi:hypothetical protein
MAIFKSINNQGSCSSLGNLYAKAKSANSITGALDSSNFVDLDGLMGKFYFFKLTHQLIVVIIIK